MADTDHVELFTDGACSGNPGPGGWGAILRFNGHEKELSGGEPATTNNRMEMMAVIEGLKALTRPCRVAVYTDSTYVQKGMTEWLAGWKAKDFKVKGGGYRVNHELWRELDELARQARCVVALGQGSCRPSGERAGGRIGAQWGEGGGRGSRPGPLFPGLVLHQRGDDAPERPDLLLGQAGAAEQVAKIAHHGRALLLDVQKPGPVERAFQVLVKSQQFLLGRRTGALLSPGDRPPARDRACRIRAPPKAPPGRD